MRVTLGWLFLRKARLRKGFIPTSPLTVWNDLDEALSPEKALSSKGPGPGMVRGAQQGMETGVLSAFLCLRVAWQMLFTTHSLCHSQVSCLPPL